MFISYAYIILLPLIISLVLFLIFLKILKRKNQKKGIIKADITSINKLLILALIISSSRYFFLSGDYLDRATVSLDIIVNLIISYASIFIYLNILFTASLISLEFCSWEI